MSEEDIKKLIDRTPSGIGLDIFPGYSPLSEIFIDNNGDIKELEIKSTRDAVILHDSKTHDDIRVDFDEFGPYVNVFTPRLFSLLYERDYLVTRYDAESRIWIYKDDKVLSRNDTIIPKTPVVYGVSIQKGASQIVGVELEDK